jgi:hypothetical protein
VVSGWSVPSARSAAGSTLSYSQTCHRHGQLGFGVSRPAQFAEC